MGIFPFTGSGELDSTSSNEVWAQLNIINFAAEATLGKLVEQFGSEIDTELYSHLPPAPSQPGNLVSLDEERAKRAAQAALDLKAQEDMNHEEWLDKIRRDVEAA